MSRFVTVGEAESLTTLVRMALSEDVGSGDWTSEWTVAPDAEGRGTILAKQHLVVAGLDPVARVFGAVDPELRLRTPAVEGFRADPGDVLMTVEGRLRSILTAERTALNFLGRLSGIATLTRRFVDAVEGTGARIVDTRKTTPGWRSLEKHAVRAGGGFNHRHGLFDMVLIKDNHIAAAGGVERAVRAVRDANERGLPVELEVSDLDQLEEALAQGVQRIMLDNMRGETLRAAARRVRELGAGRPELEASGNVDLESVREIAETGVDLISVGALTHSAPSADVTLRVET